MPYVVFHSVMMWGTLMMKRWHPSQKVKQQKLLLAHDSLCKLIGWADTRSSMLTGSFGSRGTGLPCETLLRCNVPGSRATRFCRLIEDDDSGGARGPLRSEGILLGWWPAFPSLHRGGGLSQVALMPRAGADLTPPPHTLPNGARVCLLFYISW